jgi:hypothetical protein
VDTEAGLPVYAQNAALCGQALERFRAKACPGLDPGWKPVRVKNTRQLFPWLENRICK